MKIASFVFIAMVVGSALLAGAPTQYKVAFSTYLGGSDFDAVRDVAIDSKGDIVVVGGTASTDFPVTPGAFQATLQKSTDSSSASRLGETDAYIAKFTRWASCSGAPTSGEPATIVPTQWGGQAG